MKRNSLIAGAVALSVGLTSPVAAQSAGQMVKGTAIGAAGARWRVPYYQGSQPETAHSSERPAARLTRHLRNATIITGTVTAGATTSISTAIVTTSEC